MSEAAIIGLVFGTLFFVNILSILIMYITPLGEEYMSNMKKYDSKGYRIFWHIWMLFVGLIFLLILLFTDIKKNNRAEGF